MNHLVKSQDILVISQMLKRSLSKLEVMMNLLLLLEFPNLQSLELSYVAEEVTDFQILNKLSLKSLSLKSINDLKWLSTLTNLESLAIDISEATDFSPLYSLTQLQELKLTSVRNLKRLILYKTCLNYNL